MGMVRGLKGVADVVVLVFFLGLEVAWWKEEVLDRCTTDVAV